MNVTDGTPAELAMSVLVPAAAPSVQVPTLAIPAALDVADALDEQLLVGNATGPLFCVPVLLKDNYDWAGW